MLVVVGAHARGHGTFSLPNSILLFGGSGDFQIVMRSTSEVVQIPPNPGGNKGPSAFPGLDTNATLLSSGFPVANDNSRRWKVRCAVAVYSRSERQWRTYGDFTQVNVSVVSPDHSKVAFLAEEVNGENRESLLLLDIATRQIAKLAAIPAGTLNWSPDGKKLALDVYRGEKNPMIEVFDIPSQETRSLEEGSFPAWSPSGEWIAYVDPSREKIHLVHPNGTGDHVVNDVGGRVLGYRYFGLQPVWSPDSTKLLLNEYKGDGDTHDVVLLDIKSGTITTKSHNGYPVLGWASEHEQGDR